MKRATLTVLGLLLSSVAIGRAPERTVEGNRVSSRAYPAATIVVPATATYLGAERWDLYDLADCELHLFVEADADKKVLRLYWIQFESYLPSNSHTYDYTSDTAVTFAGLPFWQRARFGPTNGPTRPGSDGERVRQMVERAGYHLPPHSMNVRLVHLPDESKRRELMLIYGEDLALAGLAPTGLGNPGEPNEAWQAARKALAERAMSRFRIER